MSQTVCVRHERWPRQAFIGYRTRHRRRKGRLWRVLDPTGQVWANAIDHEIDLRLGQLKLVNRGGPLLKSKSRPPCLWERNIRCTSPIRGHLVELGIRRKGR